MRFVILNKDYENYNENDAPFEGANLVTTIRLDWRNSASLMEARGCDWYKDWYANTLNQREERGRVVGDRGMVKTWVYEFDCLEELLCFVKDRYSFRVIPFLEYRGYEYAIVLSI